MPSHSIRAQDRWTRANESARSISPVGRRAEHVTTLLAGVRNGDGGDADRLMSLVYDELRAMARAQMARERPGHTLQPTALVHEAYLRLMGSHEPPWESRAQFFHAAARAMRRILVDKARRRRAAKRGSGRARGELDQQLPAPDGPGPVDLLALDEALARLEQRDPRKASIVMLRYFAGLSVEHTARALDLSPATVKNEWAFARALLLMELGGR